jgi:hypothetical protein
MPPRSAAGVLEQLRADGEPLAGKVLLGADHLRQLDLFAPRPAAAPAAAPKERHVWNHDQPVILTFYARTVVCRRCGAQMRVERESRTRCYFAKGSQVPSRNAPACVPMAEKGAA